MVGSVSNDCVAGGVISERKFRGQWFNLFDKFGEGGDGEGGLVVEILASIRLVACYVLDDDW